VHTTQIETPASDAHPAQPLIQAEVTKVRTDDVTEATPVQVHANPPTPTPEMWTRDKSVEWNQSETFLNRSSMGLPWIARIIHDMREAYTNANSAKYAYEELCTDLERAKARVLTQLTQWQACHDILSQKIISASMIYNINMSVNIKLKTPCHWTKFGLRVIAQSHGVPRRSLESNIPLNKNMLDLHDLENILRRHQEIDWGDMIFISHNLQNIWYYVPTNGFRKISVTEAFGIRIGYMAPVFYITGGRSAMLVHCDFQPAGAYINKMNHRTHHAVNIDGYMVVYAVVPSLNKGLQRKEETVFSIRPSRKERKGK